MKALLRYGAAAVVLSALAFMLGAYQTDIYRKLLLWVTLALSYNFLFGISGQVACSHFSFYGIGAYTIVILVTQAGLPLPLAVLATVGVCVLLALVVAIPATRLEGFYLALATLAFAQLFIVVLNEGGNVTGGNGGLDRSWFGRACRAVRDNPEAAAAMGIDVRRTKVLAYAITSAMAGVAGMVYAFVDNTVNPHIFGLENAFLLLFMVIVGGSGRHAGAILGAVLLYVLPFVLSPLIGHHHALVFGLFMVLSVLFQPKGLIALWERHAPRLRPRAAPPAAAVAAVPVAATATATATTPTAREATP